MELYSINYPGYTYSDCQWVISATNARGFILTFLDFNITFGVSLTIGHGSEFIKKNELFKIGSKDIEIEINDTVVVSTHVIWIWFKTNDPTTQVQTKTNLFDDKDGFEMDTVPYVRGIRLSITASEVGRSIEVLLLLMCSQSYAAFSFCSTWKRCHSLIKQKRRGR